MNDHEMLPGGDGSRGGNATDVAVVLAFPVATLLLLGWFGRKPHGVAATTAVGALAFGLGTAIPVGGTILMRWWQP